MIAQPASRRTLYAWLRTAALLAIALLSIETFLVMGLVSPVAIQGSSMAPTALGPHFAAKCPHCECEFSVGADQIPPGPMLACPDCWQTFAKPESPRLASGQRVWVDRTRLLVANPHRWDVVVFRCPDRPNDYCIKRVLGLGGERIDFHRGDLMIDGTLVRKSLDEQLRLRQLVHAERNELVCWHSGEPGWRYLKDRWRHEGSTTELRFEPAGGPAVTNDLGVNQAAVLPRSEALDLMVTCDVLLQPNASLEFVAEFEDGTQIALPVDTKPKAQLVWSLFDRQALLAVDGQVVYQSTHDTAWSDSPRLAIRATGDVEVRELSVWRDVYYHARPVDRWPQGGVQLAASELFVVGDNVAISSDSRNWTRRGLDRRLLIGHPLGID